MVVPDINAAARPPVPPPARIANPRLAHPEQAADFVKLVIEASADA